MISTFLLQDVYQKKSELLCPECRKPVEVAIDSLPPNILANRILEVKFLLGIVSVHVRAIGDLCCQPEFGGKVRGDDTFCDHVRGIGVRN